MVKLPETSYFQKYFYQNSFSHKYLWRVQIVCVWSIHLRSVFPELDKHILFGQAVKELECQITKKRLSEVPFYVYLIKINITTKIVYLNFLPI